MKTDSGRVLEVPKTDDGPATQQEAEQLSATYQATVRLSMLLLGPEVLVHATECECASASDAQ